MGDERSDAGRGRVTASAHLRPALESECDALTALCLRSKAHHGYDASFIAACREELSVTPERLARGGHRVAETDGRLSGFIQVLAEGGETWLESLFVDPDYIGRGIGSLLMVAAVNMAKATGATALEIHADPHAEAFYLTHGARRVRSVPSGSIVGRQLPQLMLTLSS